MPLVPAPLVFPLADGAFAAATWARTASPTSAAPRWHVRVIVARARTRAEACVAAATYRAAQRKEAREEVKGRSCGFLPIVPGP